MKVTFIGHSSFFIEWPECIWLFDYYEGTLPDIPEDKPLFIFVSHFHADHFNPAIFRLQAPAGTHYILSHDVIRHRKPKFLPENLYTMRPDELLTLRAGSETFQIHTLRSTDFGVAFLIRFHEKWVYHAGDLNWWVWKEESRQYNNNMTANFKKYTRPLLGLDLYAAFLPLDPRQEEWYDKGMLYILENTRTSHAFPMHFWKDYSVTDRFLASPQGAPYEEQIVKINHENETFIFDDL